MTNKSRKLGEQWSSTVHEETNIEYKTSDDRTNLAEGNELYRNNKKTANKNLSINAQRSDAKTTQLNNEYDSEPLRHVKYTPLMFHERPESNQTLIFNNSNISLLKEKRLANYNNNNYGKTAAVKQQRFGYCVWLFVTIFLVLFALCIVYIFFKPVNNQVASKRLAQNNWKLTTIQTSTVPNKLTTIFSVWSKKELERKSIKLVAKMENGLNFYFSNSTTTISSKNQFLIPTEQTKIKTTTSFMLKKPTTHKLESKKLKTNEVKAETQTVDVKTTSSYFKQLYNKTYSKTTNNNIQTQSDVNSQINTTMYSIIQFPSTTTKPESGQSYTLTRNIISTLLPVNFSLSKIEKQSEKTTKKIFLNNRLKPNVNTVINNLTSKNVISKNKTGIYRSISNSKSDENTRNIQQPIHSYKKKIIYGNNEFVDDNILPVEISIQTSDYHDAIEYQNHQSSHFDQSFSVASPNKKEFSEPVWRRPPPSFIVEPAQPFQNPTPPLPFFISASVMSVKPPAPPTKSGKHGNAKTIQYSSKIKTNDKRANAPIIVTALLDIGRGNWTHFTRHFDTYLSFLKKLFHLNNFMIIYCERKVINYIYGQLKNDLKSVPINLERLQIIEISLEDLPFYYYRDKMQKIIDAEQKNWSSQWDPQMSTHPEALYADYNILVNSKSFFLQNATRISRFDSHSNFFVWLDAGYGHESTNVIPTELWTPKLQSGKITVLKLTSQIENVERYTIDIVYRKRLSVISGGFLAGDSATIDRFHKFFFITFLDLLNNEKVDDDQTTLLMTISKYRSTFNVLHGGWFDAFKLLPSQT